MAFSLNDGLFILYWVYIPPLNFLYALQVYVICKHKHLHNSSFYRLFVVGAVNDVFMQIGNMFYRIEVTPYISPWFENVHDGIGIRLFFVMTYYFGTAQEVFNVSVALNRMTSIVVYANHERIWRHLIPLVAIAMLTLPMSYCWMILSCNYPSFLPSNVTGEIVYMASVDCSMFPDFNRNSVFLVIEVVSPCVSIVIYTFTTVFMRVRGLKIATVERRLFYYGMLLVLLNIPMAVLEMLLAFFRTPLVSFYGITQIPWVLDLKIFAPPILLYLFNAEIRRRVWSLIEGNKKKKPKRKTSVTMTVV